MLDDRQRRRVFAIIFVNQCLGMISHALFQNGFYLNFFTKLGLSSAAIAMVFALPSLLGMVLMLPFSFYSDRFGKRKMALRGQLMVIGSLMLLESAGWRPAWALPLVLTGIIIFSIGNSLQGANWFALMNPIVPSRIRGRFFGWLRVTFQLVGILFTLLITRTLEHSQAMAVFQGLLGIVIAAAILRYFTYARIPELENAQGEEGHHRDVGKALREVLRVPGYLRFNSYLFLITLFTAAVPTVFALMQKDVFAFEPAQITRVGTLFLIGSVIGCWQGGHMVDRLGTRMVFLITHVCYIAAMLAMLAHRWVPWSLPLHAGGCALAFSLTIGLAGVAATYETMALIPSANKSLSTGVTMTLYSGGTALSGLFVARAISWKIPTVEWVQGGETYGVYDSLLLLFSALALVLLAAIGLVPRIADKPTLMPGGGDPRQIG
jgi:MFS family permease